MPPRKRYLRICWNVFMAMFSRIKNKRRSWWRNLLFACWTGFPTWYNSFRTAFPYFESNNTAGYNQGLNGGTQTLFRDLPKFSNVGKIFKSSCSALKIVLSNEIWAHGPFPGPKNRIRHFEVWDWEKYPWKLVCWKTLGAIVISIERSSTSPKVMEK